MPYTATLCHGGLCGRWLAVPLMNGFFIKEMFFTETPSQAIVLGSLSWSIRSLSQKKKKKKNKKKKHNWVVYSLSLYSHVLSSTMYFLTASR